jgi:hypothetical protein
MGTIVLSTACKSPYQRRQSMTPRIREQWPPLEPQERQREPEQRELEQLEAQQVEPLAEWESEQRRTYKSYGQSPFRR